MQVDAPKVRNFFRETGMLVHTSRAIQKRSIVHLQKRVDINHDHAAIKPPVGFKGQTVITGINHPFPRVGLTGSEAITQSRINLTNVSQ